MPTDDSSLVIHEGAGAGSEHPVDGELILGREHGTADVVIPDPGVSRRHARVIPDDGTLVLEDLGSSNGTYLNGHRIDGPVALGPTDEVQVGDTVIGVGGTAATAVMPPNSPTAAHPGPARTQPPASGRPAPRRLAPPPHDPGNLPALAAVFLGPLSILLVFLSAGGFFVALPCGIAAIILGTIGIHNADRWQRGHRAPARIGRFTGWIGTFLATLALIVFVVVAAALHSTEHSVGGLINRINQEIDKVKVPNVNPPNPPSQSGSRRSGATAAPGQ